MLGVRVWFGLRSGSSGKGRGKKSPLLAVVVESIVSRGRGGAWR